MHVRKRVNIRGQGYGVRKRTRRPHTEAAHKKEQTTFSVGGANAISFRWKLLNILESVCPTEFYEIMADDEELLDDWFITSLKS